MNKLDIKELITEFGRDFDWLYKIGLSPEENLREFVTMLADQRDVMYSRGFDDGKVEGFKEGYTEGEETERRNIFNNIRKYIDDYEDYK